MRQGLYFKILRTIMKNDNDIEIANILARESVQMRKSLDAVFIDGGYGTGIISAGKVLGYKWQIVWFSAKSDDEGCLNKRAEMWKLMRDWLKDGGCIPEDPNLATRNRLGPGKLLLDLTASKIQLESKKDMKARGQKDPQTERGCSSFELCLSSWQKKSCLKNKIDIRTRLMALRTGWDDI